MMKKRIPVIITALIILTIIVTLSVLTVQAAQPGIVIDGSNGIAFKYLEGVKGGLGLSAVGSGSGEYKNTTLDTSRSFYVSESSVSTVAGKELSFNYRGATTGANEYVSVIIADKTNKVLYYGKLAATDSAGKASGSVKLSLPSELAVGGSYDLLFFSEHCGADGDKASSFSRVSLLIYPDPYILTTVLPATTSGVNYAYQLNADTTATSCTWEIITGQLPNGFVLNEKTGLISGATTSVGTFNFTVKVKANGAENKKALTIVINPPISISFSTNLSDQSVTKLSVPKGRTVQLTASISGGTRDYSNYQWSIDGHPISDAKSTAYKVNTAAIGTFTYTFAVSDSATANKTESITIKVSEPISPKLDHATVKFDKAAPADITITKSDGDYTFANKIICGDRTLKLSNGDFTISGNVITIPAATLKSFALGDHTLTLDYDDTNADPSFTLSVLDTSLPPEVGSISAPAAIDRGNKLSLTAPTVKTYGSNVTSQGWKIKPVGASVFSNFDVNTALECSYNRASLIYYATNIKGTSYSNEVTITVNHTPLYKWKTNNTAHWHVCTCGEVFDRDSHSCDINGDCSVCGHHCTHQFSAYTSNNDATCTADGTKTRTCSLCGYKDTVTDAGTAKGHDWSDWQVSETKHWHVCKNCNQKADEADHVPGVPATTTAPQVCNICGMLLADKLPGGDTTTGPNGGETTTGPNGGETTTDPNGGETTTGPNGGETTTGPNGGATTTGPNGGATTTDPNGGETTTGPNGGETTTDPNGSTATTTPNGNGTATDPNGRDNTTTKPNDDTSKVINITRKDDDSDQRPTFTTDTDISDSTLITIDGRPLTRDEFTLSPDGRELELHPSQELEDGKHTLVIETPNGRGEATFTIGDSAKGSFPFWLLWVVPHVFVDIAGLICIALLAIKRDDDKGDNDNNSQENKS